jgi:hypothetical protein
MKIIYPALLCILIQFNSYNSFSQDANACKVSLPNLRGIYKGECKNGLAEGNGEAQGVHRYTGTFKNGLPNGKGIYYSSETVYYSGVFQNGLKEGKGEMHYLKTGAPDSVVKGYWSGDIFRGKRYDTYKVDGSFNFDRFDVAASPESGNTLTIDISSTTGSPNGITSLSGSSGAVLTVRELIPLNNVLIRKVANFSQGIKTTATFHINEFPARFSCIISDGQKFDIELYKAANWSIRIYENK